MNELQRLIDALDYLCQGADLLATDRGLYKRDEEDMTRFDAVVTARLFTQGCAEIDADILYDDYGPDDGWKSYRRLRVCHHSDVVDSDDFDGYEFRKTLRGLYNSVFRDLVGQILGGKLTETEAEEYDGRDDAGTYGGNQPARLPLHLVRNRFDGSMVVVDDNSAVIASFTDDEIVDVGGDADLTGAERVANLKGPVRDAAVARTKSLLNRIRGNGADAKGDSDGDAKTTEEEGRS